MRTWAALDVGFGGAGASRPDLFQAALTDFGVAAIDDNDTSRWRVFFHSAAERDRACAALGPAFGDLAIAPVDVPDEDWAARSQAALAAVRVGRIIVAPPWDVPIVLTIQPSMGFGTGHHATTRLCLAALQRIDLRERAVLDAGTGSGVLAIAASRLGASRVLAIDDDPDAVQAARENVEANGAANVAVARLDLRDPGLGGFDVVVANLTGGLLIQAAARLQDLAGGHGTLVLSGFMAHEEAGVRGAFARCTRAHRAEEEEWLCVTLTRVNSQLPTA